MDSEGRVAGDDRYRTFLALSGEGIARFELDEALDATAPEDEQVQHLRRHSRIAECNDVFARFYGREAAEMQGRTAGEFVPEDDPGRERGFREFIRSGYRLADTEEAHTLPDGTTRWVEGRAIGVVEAGQLRRYWLTLADITERKRGESDREKRGRILEAVAFGAARLLEPGTWAARAPEVLARLGRAAEAARAYVAETRREPDGSSRLVFRFAWGAPGVDSSLEDPRVKDGVSLRQASLERLEAEMRAGRPVVTAVKALSEAERSFPASWGSRSFAAVPIFSSGEWWGLLGFGETRYEREWSGPEVEALKAGAAVFAAAIEREGSDEALRESEDRLKRLAAATFEGIALTENGLFLDANDQLARLLGCQVADLVGRRVEDFVPPEDHEVVRAHRESGFEGPYEHRVRRTDGSDLPVEVRVRQTPYRGRTVRVTAVRDVSERVQAEERQRRLEGDLRQAAEQWRQTFDALDLGIVLADAEGRIVRLNRTALELAQGSAFGDTVGRELEALSDGEPWRTIFDIHRRVGESRVSLTAEARDPRNGHAFYLLGSPWFRDEGDAPWRIITFRDVTDFITLESQLRRARTLEAMGSLVAGVAHEVRNPQFSISATVDALEAELGSRPEFAEYGDLLRSQVSRLTQLTRDLLDFGKPSLLQRTRARPAEVLRRAVRSCASLARDRGVSVEEHLAGELPALEIDGARIEQALENLLANAIQHAPPESVVRVLVGTATEDGSRAFLYLHVEDDGPGLPEGDLPRIFEPFFSRRKGGTGLGLSIVQRVAEAHGGSVSACNREERGARFTLRLPIEQGSDEANHGR
jgi:PAS domain S-box-containing protein